MIVMIDSKINEQRKNMLEDFKEFRKCDTSLGAKLIVRAIQKDKKYASLIRMIEENLGNIKTFPDLSMPEMRLYFASDNYFESIDELLKYCRKGRNFEKEVGIIDYYRNFFGYSDVIRKSNNETSVLYVAVSDDKYGLCNLKKGIDDGEFIWEYYYGNIKNLYEPFHERGIIFNHGVSAKKLRK
mgnify:CR=1 FL=1